MQVKMNGVLPGRARLRSIVSLSLPIMGGMMSQNLLNLADTAMVGRLGASDLAAVGMGGVATFLAFAFLLGLSPAVQAMAARRLGEGREDEVAHPLNAGVLTAACVGIPLGILLLLLAGRMFSVLSSDPAVLAAGVPYLKARMLSIAGVGINFSFRGYWNGVHRPSRYMITLTTMNMVNILLNYVFIFGHWGSPAMGAAGAGLASSVATYFGTLMYFAMGLKLSRKQGFLSARPSRTVIGTLLRLASASGLQTAFYAAGATMLFWIAGQIGTPEMAAATVIVNLVLVGVLPAMGMGLAAASLVGKALGRGDADDAYRWGWEVAAIAGCALLVPAALLVWRPGLWLRLFTSAPDVLAVGSVPLQLSGLGLPIEAIALVLMHALNGAGDNARVMRWSVLCQWGIFLPAAYVVGPLLGGSLTAVWTAQLVYRVIATTAFSLLWIRGHWRSAIV
ncbi:MAG: MATE family efflux transporter [Kiritimatiellia bacterium]|jgi:putative MATE family efflux protein|nr:MATE family efflux transporter [Kiritimatiellia bacterium]